MTSVASVIAKPAGAADLMDLKILEQAIEGIDALRDLILDLAVRGALVPQLKAEGSGSDTLKTVRLPERIVPAIDAATEKPFSVPASWCWVRLAELGRFVGGGTPSKSNSSYWSGPIPWVSPKDMKRPFIEDAEDHISEAALGASAAKLIPSPSALFVLRGMILAHSFPVAITRCDVAVNQDMRALVLDAPELAPFLLRVLQASRQRVLARVERSSHGTCRLDSAVVENLLVPIPPLHEQKRIVAKVDQLMALCDELEAKQTKKREVRDSLTTAALASLTSAATPEEFRVAWTRLEENFESLVASPQLARALRGCILDLAVRGSLNSGVPSAAPSGDERAASESYEPTFDIPSHWRWIPLGRLCRFIDYRGRTPTKTSSGVRLITAKNVRMGEIKDKPAEFIAPEDFAGWMTRGIPAVGDLLFTTEAPLGNVARLNTSERIALAQRIITLHPSESVRSEFLLIALMSPLIQASIRERATGMTAQGIKAAKLKLIPIPVPPHNEQEQIVEVVDRLSQLCAALETRLLVRAEHAAKLADAFVVSAIDGWSRPQTMVPR